MTCASDFSPIAAWALLSGRISDAASGESLLRHYGVHVRCLVVIPLLILAEPMLQRQLKSTAASLAQTRVGGPAATRALRCELWVGWALVDRPHTHGDALSWALDERGDRGFGGWWQEKGPVMRALVVVRLAAQRAAALRSRPGSRW